MAEVSISAARYAQIEKVLENYISNWLLKLDSPETTREFLSSFSPAIEWYDHAFLIRRVGHEAILGLQSAFNHCNQPFRAAIKVWLGRCANDIVRPDGQVTVNASGKKFECHVCMVMAIDVDGKITRIDEYYNRRWDDGIAESEYAIIRGASSKK